MKFAKIFRLDSIIYLQVRYICLSHQGQQYCIHIVRDSLSFFV